MRQIALIFVVAYLLVGCSLPQESGSRMIKLYLQSDGVTHYWETWENDGVHTIHWGRLGERGESKELKNSLFRSASKTVNAEILKRESEGYQEVSIEEHDVLLIEYSVEGMGETEDLDKRHRLQSRMDETLGWAGLGHCDGGSIGSGTMEVCCFVVDSEVAKKVIANDLKETEFSDYSRIYKE